MKLVPLTPESASSIFVGTLMVIKDDHGNTRNFPVYKVKITPEDGHEIILQKKDNIFFNVDRYFDGQSWVSEAYFIEDSEQDVSEEAKHLELIAEHIEKVADAFQKINSSRLSRELVVMMLLKTIGASKINQTQINLVLDYAPKLKQIYLKKQHEK